MPYAEDSFFTLTMLGRAGLVGLSTALAVCAVWVVRRLTIASSSRLFGIAAAIAVFWAFIWLTPQIYYLYYMTLFDGLPWQNVIKLPPSPGEILSLMTFTSRSTLAAHSQGIIFWFLIAAALWPTRAAGQR